MTEFPFSNVANSLKRGKYRHFKGGEYEVVDVVRSSETMEELVLYRALYGDHALWVRPLSMFLETVERDGKVRPRFEYIGKGSFVPKPGQADFTHARFAPGVNCIVKCGEKILLVKRSADMNIHPGLWNAVGGYLDDSKTVEEKAKEELREELGLMDSDIISIRTGEMFEMDELKYQKTWILHPVLIEVKTERVTLDWEASEYKWVTLDEAQKEKNVVPSFPRALAVFFPK